MTLQIMTAVVLTSCLSVFSYAEDAGKTIVVDKRKFSDVYPAVWFSPSTGDIAPIKERSEIPPDAKYEIWIEPGDPEFGWNPDQKPKGVGFALIGKGRGEFTSPSIPSNPKLELKINRLMKEKQASEQLVFYCKAKASECLIMITAMDSKKELISFQWRPLKKQPGAR